ncbi:Sugar transferase involved in LPS biosynthesis (colanic, teichoic acid) [Pedobacter steynii]|uniref:Sugar transferase involved in LPS biosynthesis (Colanic, teichoic acid) n=1 Tax=Pedobacter steynii TaxID=430522 RepID=A0A1G9RDR8_9SPHI|nr:sugar transferase [Pedobacter steynii]NQX37793.1 sugar transferase [Pedobacter steynii]SDM21200.1 Sugar transferase involved in LPS biosynthesis (colanic, teichoic acid) [Pedobacter steynii]
MDAKRLFDIFFSLMGIFFLLPVFLLVSVLLKREHKGPVFYRQTRVGLNQKCFQLIKFRTMCPDADKMGLLTIGDHDARITKVGCWLRKHKVDELPQLLNILKGEMSFVGPRPEVPKYVEMYDSSQQRVLSVKPGITDWASIRYIDESSLLATAEDPESFYIHNVIPSKISQNLEYIDHHNLWIDFKIISYTLKSILLK